MVVKTFRALLADGGQDRIRLSTIKGKVGYRIVKFNIIPNLPGTQQGEHTIEIWKKEITNVGPDAIIDFTDSDLLAVSYLENGSGIGNLQPTIVIFDNEIFNQDIYITHIDEGGTQSCNYYLELEVIPLDDKGAEYTTVKDLRTRGF